jgi:ribosome-binding protein aMBF1 (putative translation factor)
MMWVFQLELIIGYLIPWFFLLPYLKMLGMAKPSPKHAGEQVLVDLGVAIRAARLGMGLSQEALAVDAGLDRSYMGGIERGEHNLTAMNLVKISTALQLKPSELLKTSGY